MNSNQFWGIYSMVNDKKKENQTVYLHYTETFLFYHIKQRLGD